MTANFNDFLKLICSDNIAFSLFQEIRSSFSCTPTLSTLSSKIKTLSSDINTFIKHVKNDLKKSISY